MCFMCMCVVCVLHELKVYYVICVCVNKLCVMLQHSPLLVQPLVMMTFVLQDGWTPLYIASNRGHLDIVKALIEAGANVNQTNKVSLSVELFVILNNITRCVRVNMCIMWSSICTNVWLFACA